MSDCSDRATAGADNDPELMEILRRFIFGDVLDTGVLDDRIRELITVTVLACSQALPQLKSHTAAALNVGVQPVQIREPSTSWRPSSASRTRSTRSRRSTRCFGTRSRRRCAPCRGSSNLSSPNSSTPPNMHGWTQFVSMQNQYNLLRRQDERELLPVCADMGVGAVPHSPQGKGRLARPWGEQSKRSSEDKVVQSFDSPLDEPVVNAVQQIAEVRGATMAQVALAWLLNSPFAAAPIVGATKPQHLPEAVAVLDLHLYRGRNPVT